MLVNGIEIMVPSPDLLTRLHKYSLPSQQAFGRILTRRMLFRYHLNQSGQKMCFYCGNDFVTKYFVMTEDPPKHSEPTSVAHLYAGFWGTCGKCQVPFPNREITEDEAEVFEVMYS